MELLKHNFTVRLNKKTFFVLLIVSFTIAFCYEGELFSHLYSEHYVRVALKHLEKGRSLPQGLLTEQVLSYQKALRLLKKAERANFLDAGPRFYFAEIARDIGGNSQLASLLQGAATASGSSGSMEFYHLSKAKYIEAITLSPTSAKYHWGLALVFQRMGEDGYAERFFKNALVLDPNNVTMNIALCKFYRLRNREAFCEPIIRRFLVLYRAVPRKRYHYDIQEFLKSIGKESLIQ